MEHNVEVDRLKEQEDIETALKQTAGTKEKMSRPVAKTGDKLWFGTYVLVLLGLVALFYLLELDFFPGEADYILLLRRLSLGSMIVVLILGIAKGIHVYWINQMAFVSLCLERNKVSGSIR